MTMACFVAAGSACKTSVFKNATFDALGPEQLGPCSLWARYRPGGIILSVFIVHRFKMQVFA